MPRTTLPVDDGLFYTSLSGSKVEWDSAFPSDKLENYGPMHFWSKCIHGDIRAYFFFERVEEGMLGISASEHKPIRGQQIFFYIDGIKVEAKLEGAGGEFFFHRKSYSLPAFESAPGSDDSCIHIAFENWVRYICLPRHFCTSSIDSTSGHNSEVTISKGSDLEYVFNAFTWDSLLDNNDNIHKLKSMVLAVEKHISYHTCLLESITYDLIVHPDHLPIYLSSPLLSEASQRGVLRFLLKGNHPSMLQGVNPNWQSIYQNLALLQYWQHDNIRLFFVDSDEFLFIDPTRRPEFDKLAKQLTSALHFVRISTVCIDCVSLTSGNLDTSDVYYSFNRNHYIRKESSALEIGGKLLVSPNSVGLLYVHKAYHGKTTSIDPTLAYFHHFENFISNRVSLLSSTKGVVVVSVPLDPSTIEQGWTNVNLTSLEILTKCDLLQFTNTSIHPIRLDEFINSMLTLRLHSDVQQSLLSIVGLQGYEWTLGSVFVITTVFMVVLFRRKCFKARLQSI